MKANHPKHQKVFDTLDALSILYTTYYHPPIPTIEAAMAYWKEVDSSHCKNIFLRNHKGNRHYLVIFHCEKMMKISDLEQRLKQGKLSFASEQRLEKYLDIKPGSVSPFGIINDKTKHVHLFIDENLLKSERLSFHPNDNTATVVISKDDFLKFLDCQGNSYEFIRLYDD
ncbi:MAG: prolyl-tRNA synthetase associated domain-containing protein [Lentimicrobiaceae bacterium]|jgi:Ala-tRNA(Pro) deacylase|nr:prolyl-tRNA synthetase associated domain-containing protein [Lentimicrobiaceae bacterium]